MKERHSALFRGMKEGAVFGGLWVVLSAAILFLLRVVCCVEGK